MNEIEAFIRAYAPTVGIDPDVAVAVAKSEGGLNDPVRRAGGPAPRSQDPKLGRFENSYGPFQLYVSGTGAGLGDRAVAAGINPADPNQWKQGVMFALKEAAQKGWGQWYGAANAGIDRWQGISGKPQAKQYALDAKDMPPPSLGGIGPYTPATGPGGPIEAAGGGAGSEAGSQPPAAPATPYGLPMAPEKEKKNFWQVMGEGIADAAGAMAATPMPGYQLPATPGPARVDVGAAPFVDPQQAEMRRQALAYAMQRLNQGSLW